MHSNLYSKACALGYCYIDTDNGRVAKDGTTWLVHFLRRNVNSEFLSMKGIWVGWNGKRWVIEED